MGVDFYPCNYCGETFCDCGDFERCECGVKWCSLECAEKEGYTTEIKGKWGEGSCNFCREEDFEDSILLDFALSLLEESRMELIEQYKQSK